MNTFEGVFADNDAGEYQQLQIITQVPERWGALSGDRLLEI